MLITTLRHFLAGILVLLGIGFLITAIWSFASQGIFLNPDTVKNGLADQDIYADIVPVALPALVNRSGVEPKTISIQAITNALSPQDWRTVADDLVPPDWLQNQTEHALDLFFAWINGSPNAVQQEIFDLTGLRDHLTGETAQKAVDTILRTAPACQPDDIDRLEALDKGRSAQLPICHPPDEYVSIARTTLSDGLAELANQLSTRSLTLASFANPENRNAILAVPLLVQIYRQVISLFYLCPIGILALVVTLVVRSRQGFGSWIGITLITSGILAILPLPFISLQIVDNTATFLTTGSSSPEFQLFRARLYSGVLNSAFAQVTSPVILQAVILLLAGIGLLVIAFWNSERQAIGDQALVSIPDTASQKQPAALETSETQEEI